MKKKLPCLLLLLVICLLSLCFAACISGINGKDGKSAYEIWLDNGHIGTETDFLEWLKGDDGKNGTNGANGANGTNGTDGTDGAQGEKGDKGDTGAQGEKGDKGDTGAQGEKGDKGDTGAQGEKGDKGDTGAQGEKGQDGIDGLSAYEIFLKYYPYYTGTEEQWINGLVNGELKVHKITFKSEVADDIVKYLFEGYPLYDIPEVPEKEGQTSASWDITDFSDVTQDIEVNAVYDMRKYVTFHNEFTDDEDIVIVVNYGETLIDTPTLTQKAGNESSWWDAGGGLSNIKTDMLFEARYVTRGLQYTLFNQQTEYKVSKGEMSSETTELFIPEVHRGKPVTVIDEEAFNGSNIEKAYIPDSVTEIRAAAFCYCNSLKSIVIPDSVTVIGQSAFFCCDMLTDIIIPNSVTVIERSAFHHCMSLTDITIPDSISELAIYVFGQCFSLTSITIPNSVTAIHSLAFYDCRSLSNVIIPDSVTYIAASAFSGCSGLTSITIPNSISSIESGTFYGCNKLESIFYKGSKAEFEKINIETTNNVCFTDAMVYYYTENKPTENGYYWHYDKDGVTPVIWVKED